MRLIPRICLPVAVIVTTLILVANPWALGQETPVLGIRDLVNQAALSSTSEKQVVITVDFARTVGVIKSLQGVVAGPLVSGARTGMIIGSLREQYLQIGVDFVRSHDTWGAFDIDIVFPNMQADPSKESSYNFTNTDLHVEAIRSTGAQVFYSLGYSWNSPHNELPSNYTKFSEICKHILLHYNHGWANGFDHRIQYWKLWTEPDLTDKQFWRGTPEQYFRLYDTVAKALKAIDPDIKVGGPGVVWNMAFLEEFLKFCKANRSPLDFASWHSYPERPPYFVAETAQKVQGLLNRYGFKNVENFLTEWNYSGAGLTAGPELWNARGAAWTASVLIYLQDTPVSRAARYRGPSDGGGGQYGLFSLSGEFQKTAYAFLAMKRMLDTPIRLACDGSNKVGFAVLAGRSASGNAVRVLISDFDADYDEFALVVNGFPWQGKTLRVQTYLLDDGHDLTLVQENEQLRLGSPVIQHKVAASSVYLVSVEQTEPGRTRTTLTQTGPATSGPETEPTSETITRLSAGGRLQLAVALIFVFAVVITYGLKKRRDRERASDGKNRATIA